MGIAVGSTDIGGAYVGSTAVDAMYLGSTKVWPTISDWLTTSGLTFTYTESGSLYEPDEWDSGTITGVDTGDKWVGDSNDRITNININGGANALVSALITLDMRTDGANPGAGSNTGFTTFKLLIRGSDGWSPTTLNLARTSATYSSTYNSVGDYYTEQWVWARATTGLYRNTSTDTFRMLSGSGLIV